MDAGEGPTPDGEKQRAQPPEGAVACPHCGECLEITTLEQAQRIACPSCAQELVVPAADGSTELPEEPEEDAVLDREAELDGLRMRNIVASRRAAMRSRTYAVAGGVGCLIGAAKLITMTVHHVTHYGWGASPAGYVLFTILAVAAMAYCFKKAAYWNQQSRGSALSEPQTPPDFSSLRDGSDRWKDFEQIS